MDKLMILFVFVFVCACPLLILGQGMPHVDKICSSYKHIEKCDQLQRGQTDVVCQWVQDPLECAQRLINNTATLGVFSAESVLNIASLSLTGFVVVRELRHRDRIDSLYDYDSVVIVRNTHTHGLAGLNNLNFCHPGLYYDRTQRWSELFLKYFERKVVSVNCDIDGKSPAEIETSALSRYFKGMCRPGLWSNDIKEDLRLKSKYRNLCSLCGNQEECSYSKSTQFSSTDHHQLALECLKNNGDVAYVSGDDAKSFLASNNNSMEFGYLCPDGTVSSVACPWLKQPWGVLLTSDSIGMDSRIANWEKKSTAIWRQMLLEIINPDDAEITKTTIQSPIDYIRSITPMPVPDDLCNTTARWCTVNDLEKHKCEVLRHIGITTGIYPLIDCLTNATVGNDVSCLNEINSSRSDFTGIDSNFGYLARYPYNLTGALYVETEIEKYSSVVVVVKANSKYTNFESLKNNANGCFPEYGGIASIAFVNIGKSRGFLDKDDCHISKLLNDFFKQSCFPGARDKLHDPSNKHSDSLCSLCKTDVIPKFADISSNSDVEVQINNEEVNEHGEIVHPESSSNLLATCNADLSNKFYGNRGALQCLSETGDVAVLELQYLHQHAATLRLNPNDYKIICRNGSLAAYTGFDVDQNCALTTIVDGEIVVRRNDYKTVGIVNALLSLDKYTQKEPQFKMYNIFSSERNVLFKDSTVGLVSPFDTNVGKSVERYIKLFENIESCIETSKSTKSAALINTFNFSVSIITILFTMYFR